MDNPVDVYVVLSFCENPKYHQTGLMLGILSTAIPRILA